MDAADTGSYRKGEILVAEATGVICSSDGTARLPGAYMGAISWQAVEAYIQDPSVIVRELRYVMKRGAFQQR